MKECDFVEEEKILVGFYNDSIDPYMDILEKFDKDDFKVNLFDNIGDIKLEEFNLDNILINLLGDNHNKKSISIISNNGNLLVYLYKKYSFLYNAFVFDNFISNSQITIDEDSIYEGNFNLYSLKETDECIFLEGTDIYVFLQAKLENYIKNSRKICEDEYNFKKYYYCTNEKAIQIKNYIEQLSDEQQQNIQLILKESIDNENIQHKIYLYSFLLLTFNKKEYAEELINSTINSQGLLKENRFFIMYQLISQGFTNSSLSQNISSCNNIYDKVFEEFEQAVGHYNFISKKYRKKDLVFVFTSQALNLTHGPTKTALDRCYNLIKHMNKRVILINTCELVTSNGLIPFDTCMNGSKFEEYSSLNSMKYKDIDIPFYQPECLMPDENECINILNMVKKYKPYVLFNIGGYSITADLCSKIVPMATISTSGNYSISKTKGQFFIMGRKPNESDYNYISKLGYRRDAIIESPFTFDVKPQSHNYTRKDFGIPEDKFVLTIIGARLQREVDENLLEVFEELTCRGCYVVSMGGFILSEQLASKYPNFKNNFKDLGFQNDALACIDLIDLYINPKRQGGGTSAVECMYKEKPAISLKYGDVSMLLYEEGLVNDYQEMIQEVEKFKNDKEYYYKISEVAKEKASDLMNTKKYLKKMYTDIIYNPLFK